MSVTSQEYRAALDTQRRLVEVGIHPSVAGALATRALDRVLDSGLGKAARTRHLDRSAFPSTKPRWTSPTSRCTSFVEIAGQDAASLVKIQQYEAQGFNVIRTEPYPGKVVYYACPPGQMPHEAQSLVLQSEFVV